MRVSVAEGAFAPSTNATPPLELTTASTDPIFKFASAIHTLLIFK